MSWTDTVQATLMIFALILTPVFVIIAVGGIDTAMVQVAAQNASNLDMFKNLDFIGVISLMAWGLATSASPTSWRASWRRTPTTPWPAPVASA